MDFSYRGKVVTISNIRMYIRHVYPTHVHYGDSVNNNLDLISNFLNSVQSFYDGLVFIVIGVPVYIMFRRVCCICIYVL